MRISRISTTSGRRLGRRLGPTAGASKRGFTLVELVIVMTLIAIGFFAVRPVVATARRSAEKRAALRHLVSMLGYARTGAVAQARLVRVTCAARDGAFYAERQVDPRADRAEFELMRVLGRSQLVLPEELAIDELTVGGQDVGGLGEALIYFYPDGSTDGAALALLDRYGNETVIELSAVTGRVTVSE